MIQTSIDAWNLTEKAGEKIREIEAEKQFPIVMKAIEERAKSGYVAITLDYTANKYLVKMLTDAGFEVEFPPLKLFQTGYLTTSVSWWRNLNKILPV